jgi:hypothetical protein
VITPETSESGNPPRGGHAQNFLLPFYEIGGFFFTGAGGGEAAPQRQIGGAPSQLQRQLAPVALPQLLPWFKLDRAAWLRKGTFWYAKKASR